MVTPATRQIAWVVGQALGHVSRACAIARALRACQVDSIFVGHDVKGYLKEVLGTEFPLHVIKSPQSDAQGYAEDLEAFTQHFPLDGICYDLNPLPALVLYKRPTNLPEIFVSNFFLTGGGAWPTGQSQSWECESEFWNRRRQASGLAPLSRVHALYQRDLLLHCDPPTIIPRSYEPPANSHVTGYCAWEPSIAMPVDCAEYGEILLVSWGTTGGEIPFEELSNLAIRIGARVIVVVGTVAQVIPKTSIPIYHYERLPLSQILEKTRLVVSQGGAGSTYKGLTHGVPVVCIPNHHNQKLLAGILEAQGFSISISSMLSDADPLGALERVREKLQPMVSDRHQGAGAGRAAARILDLLNGDMA
jgi:UDP:flavonoid glycosyltransferase YjiC (YdhE family)